MPDPLRYLQAIIASLVSSAILVLILDWFLPQNRNGQKSVCLLAMGLGVASGMLVLRFQFALPPANALDRLFLISLPAVLVVELVGSVPRFPRRLLSGARIGLVALTVPLLFYGSVYLRPLNSDQFTLELAGTVLLSSGLMAASWISMHRLAVRSSDLSIPVAVSMATASAGLLVMMAGYLKGGAAAFPLAASLVGTSVSSYWVERVARSKRFAAGQLAVTDETATAAGSPVPVGIGMVGLFGILFVGRFFGGITTGTALVVLLAPLLCWVGELPGLRHAAPWKAFLLRLTFVAIPLVIVLAAAKRDFDRDMVPLMMRRPESHQSSRHAPSCRPPECSLIPKQVDPKFEMLRTARRSVPATLSPPRYPLLPTRDCDV